VRESEQGFNVVSRRFIYP